MTIDGKTAQAAFEWDCAGSRNFDYDDYFIPEIPSDIVFYPTLDEIATEDADSDGVAGEGAIDGHVMDFDAIRIKVDYWSYNFQTGQYIDVGTDVVIPVTPDTNPVIRFGVTVNQLINIGAVMEEPSGKYTSAHIVHDYISIEGSVIKCIIVQEYAFDVFDMEVYKCN